MTSPTVRLKFGFDRLQLDRPSLENRWDVLLGVVAEFSIEISDRVWLREPMFPVIELSASLRRWLDDLALGLIHDFSYESLESDEKSLLDFVQQAERWIVRSPLEEYEENGTLTLDEIRTAASKFVLEVQKEALIQLNLEVGRWTFPGSD